MRFSAGGELVAVCASGCRYNALFATAAVRHCRLVPAVGLGDGPPRLFLRLESFPDV
ncbi:MAG: hypothetical protein JJU36_01815 [Phycisphaeraceae bacterium]|nr:hypothetical protein [Phycisphaeraceae bacterium]